MGFWESHAEFAFEDLLFWLLLAALGPSCYPFLVCGVATIARYFIRRKRWGFFWWSYIYPSLLLLFSSFQYLIIVDFNGNVDSIIRLFTAQDADCQLPVALLCGPYIPTVEFFPRIIWKSNGSVWVESIFLWRKFRKRHPCFCDLMYSLISRKSNLVASKYCESVLDFL